MGYADQNVIQHDFGFPRLVRPAEQEEAALYAMLVSLGATRLMAEKLMRAYPKYRAPCQAIVDCASDGEGDMRGAIEQLEEENAARSGGGAAGRYDFAAWRPSYPLRSSDPLDR